MFETIHIFGGILYSLLSLLCKFDNSQLLRHSIRSGPNIRQVRLDTKRPAGNAGLFDESIIQLSCRASIDKFYRKHRKSINFLSVYFPDQELHTLFCHL